jgi:hypothetical protein
MLLSGVYVYKTHFSGNYSWIDVCGLDGPCIKQESVPADSSGAAIRYRLPTPIVPIVGPIVDEIVVP